MVSKNVLLGALPAFKNEKKLIVDDQDTGDIARAMLKAHKNYAGDYNKIYGYFAGADDEQTAENVFDFLKRNVNYVPEKKEDQILKSPSAIIATGKITGSDCKNYSLFINGVLDAYRRNEQRNFDVKYRFASYDNNRAPEHVFSVIADNDGNEIWVDPVLGNFDERDFIPTYYSDKKINSDMLTSLSGIDGAQYDNYPMPHRYETGFNQYGNYRDANSPRYNAPSSKGNSGIGAVDYTPYLFAGAIAVAFYIFLK